MNEGKQIAIRLYLPIILYEYRHEIILDRCEGTSKMEVEVEQEQDHRNSDETNGSGGQMACYVHFRTSISGCVLVEAHWKQ